MIMLHQFRPHFGIPNASPFCMKLETWLRLTGLEYQVVEISDPRKSPLGKVPWIVDEQGARGDSSAIIEYLRTTRKCDPDRGLSAVESARALALQRLLEEHLYQAVVYYRWVTDEGWAEMTETFRGVPAVVRLLVTRLVRRKIARDLRGHGISLHSREAIFDLAGADLKATSALLGDGPFFFGQEPCTIDTIIYSLLANILHAPMDASTKERARSLNNLEPYCQRMKERFFPAL